jgi:hypothetical protein
MIYSVSRGVVIGSDGKGLDQLACQEEWRGQRRQPGGTRLSSMTGLRRGEPCAGTYEGKRGCSAEG